MLQHKCDTCCQMLGSMLTSLNCLSEAPQPWHAQRPSVFSSFTRLAKLSIGSHSASHLDVSEELSWFGQFHSLHALSLRDFRGSTSGFSSLVGLRHLSLKSPQQAIVNISGCSQLTYLRLILSSSGTQTFHNLMLLSVPGVQLHLLTATLHSQQFAGLLVCTVLAKQHCSQDCSLNTVDQTT